MTNDNFGSSVVAGPGMVAAVENRVTMPEAPGYGGGSANMGGLTLAYNMLGLGDQWTEEGSGRADVALTWSAFWACVRIVTNAFVSVNWHCYERGADGRRKLPLHDDVSWLLEFEANPECAAVDWRGAMVADALIVGNGYSEIERTVGGKPNAFWRIDPSRVQLVRDDTAALFYMIDNGPGEKPSYLEPANVFHLKGPSPDGLVGWSVVRLARRTTRLGLAMEKWGDSYFGRSPMPGGFVTVPGNLTDQQRREYSQSFQNWYGGTANGGRVITLSNGVTFTPATLANDDSQFLESRTFQIGEVARWFGVPPSMLAELGDVNFSISEDLALQFVRSCILPWARRLESEADRKMYGRTNRGRRFTRLDLDALSRGNTTAQVDKATKLVNAGIWYVNEGREYLGLNPDPDGNKLIVNSTMVTLESVVSPPEPAPAPMAPPAPAGDQEAAAQEEADQEEDDQEQQPKATAAASAEDVRRAFGTLLAGVYAHLFRVDSDKARRASNKGQLAAHAAEWYAAPAAVDRVRAALLPVLEGACLAAGLPLAAATTHAEAAARSHVERCRAELLEGGAGLDGWESRPAEDAAEQINRVLGGAA